ncbi:DUF885 family protein [Mucilaginibacter terrae]|uniref:DUF885 family protein n=1 Tax=Mucilaginibacter terrae TaxID=1955052 RepID=UPI0036701E76
MMMKRFGLMVCGVLLMAACKQAKESNPNFGKLLESYYEDRLVLYPFEATAIGDNRYNDKLPNDGSAEFMKQAQNFYKIYINRLHSFKRDDLSEQDKLSYDVLDYQMRVQLDSYNYPFEQMPFNQMFSLPLTVGQFGSGASAQPFKTVKDYNNWLKRLSAFQIWADTAVANFQKGVKAGIVMPHALVIKMIPQMESMVVSDATKSLFYKPVKNMPKGFSAADKQTLTEAYKKCYLDCSCSYL